MHPLKWIIAYKFVRAVLSLVAGVGCLVIALSWLDAGAREWARQLGMHAASGVWLELAQVVSAALQNETLPWIGAAFVADATLVFIEGLALWRGWWWGRWLVIAASLAFAPLELVVLLQVVSAVRILALALDLLIAFWLVRHKLSPASGFSRPPEALPR